MSNLDEAKQQAIRRLSQKRAYRNQVQQYLLVNAVLIVLWAATDRGYFWPIWPIVGWGLSLLIQAWKLSHPARPFSDAETQSEMER